MQIKFLAIRFYIFAEIFNFNFMLSVSNLSVQFGKRILFDDVNTSFNNGNCYGIIGANGSGKSTFLKILAGKLDPTSGNVHLEPGKRMSVLEQNHNLYDNKNVLILLLFVISPYMMLNQRWILCMQIITMKMQIKLE